MGKIDKEACYVCTPGTNYELCKTFPSTKDDNECRTACKNQYSAKSYFYKNKTKQCYCGKTKADCDQYRHVTEACTRDSKEECILVPGTSIKGEPVPADINSNQQCRDVCNKILRADGLYCANKCICTNPSISPVDQDDVKKIERHIRSTCDSKDTLFCTDEVTPVQTEATAPSDIFPKDYFEYGTLLPNETSVKNAFCGCDQSVVSFYNDVFKKVNPKPTLGGIWQEAVRNIEVKNPDKSDHTTELYSEFINTLTKYASYPGENKLDPRKVKALIAFEMCRVTNDKYSRTKDPAKETMFTGPWLEYHLGEGSDSGKLLHRAVKILVMGMLLHILFRTLVPKGGNIRESLFYAMYMPHQFLQGNTGGKTTVMLLSVFFLTSIMFLVYSYERANRKDWEIFGGTVGGSLLVFLIGFFAQKTWAKGLGAFGVVASLIGLVFAASLKDPAGGVSFLEYFLPKSSSTKDIFFSGLAINVYALIISALLTRFRPFRRLKVWIVPIALIVLSLIIIQPIYKASVKKPGDEYWTQNWTIYYSVLAVLAAIFGLANFFTYNPLTNEYFIPFVLSTLFGILPLAIFTVIMNFAIAGYSPGIELLFLVLYRIAGLLVARNPNSGLGKLLISLFGKKPTDKWVMPFLPLVSHFIRIFYAISGDNLPGYFKTTSSITGVSNTNMWLS